MRSSAGVPNHAKIAWVRGAGWKTEPNSGDTNCHLDWVTAKVTVVPVPNVSIGKAAQTLEKRR